MAVFSLSSKDKYKYDESRENDTVPDEWPEGVITDKRKHEVNSEDASNEGNGSTDPDRNPINRTG